MRGSVRKLINLSMVTLAAAASITVTGAGPAAASYTYQVTVPANAQGGVNTGILDNGTDLITVTASGSAGYGYEGTQPCVGYPTTHPDGSRYLGSVNCGPKNDPNAALPGAAIGLLIGKIGTTKWFSVGSGPTEPGCYQGWVFLAYNDSTYSDNTGSYTATINVQPDAC